MGLNYIITPWFIHGPQALIVIPAQAGVHGENSKKVWIPATARDDTECVRSKDLDTAIESRYD